MAINLTNHDWKFTLYHLRRSFIKYCDQASVTFNGFLTESPIRVTDQGERIWLIYTVCASSNRHWWQATFSDSMIAVRAANGVTYTVKYAHIESVVLPEKSDLAKSFGENECAFDEALVRVKTGDEYALRGSVFKNMHDIYLWHHLGAAVMDQRRQADRNHA